MKENYHIKVPTQNTCTVLNHAVWQSRMRQNTLRYKKEKKKKGGESIIMPKDNMNYSCVDNAVTREYDSCS